jgi:hypothetical protein
MAQETGKAAEAAEPTASAPEIDPRAVMTAQIEAFEALAELVEAQRRAWAGHLHKPAAKFIEKAAAFSTLGREALKKAKE